MKRSLNERDYWEILRDINCRGQKKPLLDVMRRWDEARTLVNPNAKWYEVKTKENNMGFWEGTSTRDKFRCSKCGAIFKIPVIQSVPAWNYCPKCGQKNQEESD